MMTTNIKIINTLLAIDIVIIAICIYFGDRDWLYTSQIALFSSALVISSSMLSYRRMVDKGVEIGAVVDIDRDELDKLDDPYDLYSEDKVEKERELVDVVKDERAKLKQGRRSIKEVAKDSKPAFSFFRLGAYVVLVLGFFYLNRHEYLHIPSYLISLSFPPLVVIFVLLSESYAKQKEIN
jgi:hypothetical protein